MIDDKQYEFNMINEKYRQNHCWFKTPWLLNYFFEVCVLSPIKLWWWLTTFLLWSTKVFKFNFNFYISFSFLWILSDKVSIVFFFRLFLFVVILDFVLLLWVLLFVKDLFSYFITFFNVFVDNFVKGLVFECNGF